MERPPRKWFRCASEYHMIENFPKQVCFNEKVNRACGNGKNNSDCKIYASMAWIFSNDEWENHGKNENWDRTLVQEGWQNTRIVYGTRVMYEYTRLSLGLD